MQQKNLYYGVAYYYEYLPYDRLNEDIQMMKKANINLVRIGESTWSTYEPQEGVFDFSSLEKVLKAMKAADIKVIVGTPTYAIPTWLAKKYPEVMLRDLNGTKKYGARQIFNYNHPTFRYLAERIIRKIVEKSFNYSNVIGFQVDNETRHFNMSNDDIYIAFQKYLKEKFHNDLNKLNYELGLNYWSNRINAWEDFPPINSTINGSLAILFEEFKRSLVKDYLSWQTKIVNEYKKPHQFVTNNFDFEWRQQSFGINAEANHFDISNCFDITAVDIYHPSQDDLTGIEIAFCGDFARSTKNKNYIVMETEAQAFRHWTPYPNQLRLQAFSHIASGANTVEYWHWHSIHNSFETYWKGLLSHDFQPNPIYNESCIIGKEFKLLSPYLVNTTKKNKVALLVSHNCLSAIDWFPYKGRLFDKTEEHQYNDIIRAYYDELYKLNVEVDIIELGTKKLNNYQFIIAPSLYSISDEDLITLNDYVKNGGIILYSFRSGFSNENAKVRTCVQPGIISKACGVKYNMFVEPQNVTISGIDELSSIFNEPILYWMELLTPTTGKSLAKYNHQYWGKYSAITENKFGKGTAYYVGTYLNSNSINKLLTYILKINNLWTNRQNQVFPIINKCLKNSDKYIIEFYFNYSNNKQSVIFNGDKSYSLLTNKIINNNDIFTLNPWDFNIFITNKKVTANE